MISAELTVWMRETAFPFWADHGIDHIGGGFFELLGHDGLPLESPRRARLTARQIYCFAMAHRLAPDAGYDAIVQRGMGFLCSQFVTPEARVISSLNPDGTIVSLGPDLYDDAFVLFALAHVPAQDGAAEDLARKIAERMILERGRSDGAFRDVDASLLANPMMHLLEAFIAWWEVTHASFWKDLAEGIVTCARDHMIQPKLNILPEIFSPNWDLLPDASGLLVEPGHHHEWGWLLARWARHTDQPELLALAINLAKTAEAFGLSREHGCVVTALNERGEVRDASAKLWPQAERAKFWHEIASHPYVCAADQLRAGPLRDAALCCLQGFWQDMPAGLWREVRRPDGAFVEEPVRASSLYHIVCAGVVTATTDPSDASVPHLTQDSH
jgi:mannose-6-phosphate isomerase